MKSSFLHFLPLCVALLVLTTHANLPQKFLSSGSIIAEAERPWGHNNATYGPVPKDEQLFSVEFLEIAPTPIKADRTFFIYLRGWLPSPTSQSSLNPSSPDPGLTNATLKVSSSAIYPDGSIDPYESLTIPFQSQVFNDAAHLVIRDESGEQVGFLPSTGIGDVLLDFQTPNMFLRTGEWTFEVDARMGDEADTCLFAFRAVQWLEGGLR